MQWCQTHFNQCKGWLRDAPTKKDAPSDTQVFIEMQKDAQVTPKDAPNFHRDAQRRPKFS